MFQLRFLVCILHVFVTETDLSDGATFAGHIHLIDSDVLQSDPPHSRKCPIERQNYCLNGGVCYRLPFFYQDFCVCASGYTGHRCQDRMIPPDWSDIDAHKECVMDLAFAIDDWGAIATYANGSHDAAKWKLILKSFQSLVRSLDVGPFATHVAFFTFGSYIVPYFEFNRLQTADDVVNSVRNISYRGCKRNHAIKGKSTTRTAMLAVNDLMFQSNRGDRPSIPNVLVMVTDYITETPKLMTAVNDAKDHLGTLIIGIGFTSTTNATLMRMVVTEPSKENYFEVPELEDLNDIVDDIADASCSATKRKLAAGSASTKNYSPD